MPPKILTVKKFFAIILFRLQHHSYWPAGKRQVDAGEAPAGHPFNRRCFMSHLYVSNSKLERWF